MRINHQTLRGLGAASFLALALASTGCHSTDRSTGQAINDTMTAHEVHSALSHDPLYKFSDVNVNVFNGTAQLTGFVSNDEQRRRAAEVAAGVKGVSQVMNEITIKPTPTGPAAIHDPVRDPHIPPPSQPQPAPIVR